MNPIALINTTSGGLDGRISFPPSNPSNQYLSGNGDWITITAGSGSRTRTVIRVTNQASLTGTQTTHYNSVHGNVLQHTPGTDTVVYAEPASTINMCLPASANEGDRITIIVAKTSYELHLYPCTSTAASSRTVYDTSLAAASQKGANTSTSYYALSGSNFKGNLEFYYTQGETTNSSNAFKWRGQINSMMG